MNIIKCDICKKEINGDVYHIWAEEHKWEETWKRKGFLYKDVCQECKDTIHDLIEDRKIVDK